MKLMKNENGMILLKWLAAEAFCAPNLTSVRRRIRIRRLIAAIGSLLPPWHSPGDSGDWRCAADGGFSPLGESLNSTHDCRQRCLIFS